MYNPFDPAQVDDHDEVLATLRREHPVAEVMPGVFYVSRYADVLRVLHDPIAFPQGGLGAVDGEDRPLDERALFELDPPVHTAIRRGFSTALSPKRIGALEPAIRAICSELVDGFGDRSTVDIVAELGVPLPSLVVGQLAGFDGSEAPAIRGYCDAFVRAVADPAAIDGEGIAQCAAFENGLRGRVAERRTSATPPDDLLTALVKTIDDAGRPLSDDRVLTHLSKDVFIGGLETTTHLIGNLFFQILSAPGLYERLRNDRSLTRVAVEESLRHLSPVQIAFRRAATDHIIADTAVPAGAVLLLGLASANRDDTEFPHADRYDIDRGDELRRHVAFDRGIHACVGAPLVRLEARLALDAVLDRYPLLELSTGTRYERVRHFMMRGPATLQVELRSSHPH